MTTADFTRIPAIGAIKVADKYGNVSSFGSCFHYQMFKDGLVHSADKPTLYDLEQMQWMVGDLSDLLEGKKPTNEIEDTVKATVLREQSARAGKVFCFVPVVNMHHAAKSPFMVAIAVLGEAGYTVPRYPVLHETYDSASEFADKLNALLPYDDTTRIGIIADTMNRSRIKAEEEDEENNPLRRKYLVTVHFGSETGARNADRNDQMVDNITGALEDEFLGVDIEVEAA